MHYVISPSIEACNNHLPVTCRNLNTRLQTELHKFLNIRGVNNDLTKFLHKYMINKDRIELIRWLGKVQSYFEK